MKRSPKTGRHRAVAAPLSALLVLLLSACSKPGVAPAWEDYTARYYRDGRIVDTGNAGISHSEGQGYGMLLAAHFGDERRFDALWRWTRGTLARQDGLFSWRYRPCAAADASCIDDANNASDGDLLIAWALLRGAERFGDPGYTRAARRIAAAMRDHLLVEAYGYRLLLPGREGFVQRDEGGMPTYRLNLSYWIFPALARFAETWDDGGIWATLADDGLRLLRVARFGKRRLHPDWLLLAADGPRLAADDARYGYNACRIPLHLAWSEPRSAVDDLLRPYAEFWREGGPPPAWVDLASGDVAPYPWSDGMAAIAGTALAISPSHEAPLASGDGAYPRTSMPADDAPHGDGDTERTYFSDSLRLLAAVARSERE